MNDAWCVTGEGSRQAGLAASSFHETFELPRYIAWLDAHAEAPLRLVVAPPGAGKTASTAAWASRHPGRVQWVSVPAGCDARALCDRIDEALQAAEDAQLSASACVTIVVDDVENADASARDVLGRLCTFAPESITFVFLARSRATVDVYGAAWRGLVAVADPVLLHFAADEVGLFAESLSVPWTPLDAIRLLRATGGWAMAVAGSLRTAHARGIPLTEAFSHWYASHKRCITALIDGLLDGGPLRDAHAFRRVFGSADEPASADLVQLANAGLFVERCDDALRPNPVIAAALGGGWATRLTAGETAPAQLEMFGRFRMIVNGRDVRFTRRREAQILQFLALRATGRATRAELLDVFWPDGDRQLAAQGLRTALSAIRSAIAACAGADAVDRYFSSHGDAVALCFEAVVSAAHRLKAHAYLAVAAEARDDDDLARIHWNAVRRLHPAPLLSGEPSAAWIEPAAAEYALLAEAAHARIVRSPETVYSPVA